MEIILRICERCAKAINDAARENFRQGDNPGYYDGCAGDVCFPSGTQIHIEHKPNDGFHVQVYHWTNQETPNFDKAITDYLDGNADPEAEWQEEHDNADRARLDGLDSGFGSWQDYYDYMYS